MARTPMFKSYLEDMLLLMSASVHSEVSVAG